MTLPLRRLEVQVRSSVRTRLAELEVSAPRRRRRSTSALGPSTKTEAAQPLATVARLRRGLRRSERVGRLASWAHGGPTRSRSGCSREAAACSAAARAPLRAGAPGGPRRRAPRPSLRRSSPDRARASGDEELAWSLRSELVCRSSLQHSNRPNNLLRSMKVQRKNSAISESSTPNFVRDNADRSSKNWQATV